MKLKPLEHQTIVITGGTSGIGLATARMAAERGANLVILARNGEGLEKVADEIRAHGGRVDTVEADVGSRDEVRRAVDAVVERHGGFDTWVNNAGVGAYATIEEMSDEDHEQIVRTNYWGVVYGSTEALKVLKKRGGALINVGSISSDIPAPLLSAYTATKHAVKGFNDSLRLELMHEDAPVSVTLIQPSGIDTPFGRHAKNYMDAASKVPQPVYSPDLVAKAICHAAEHETRNMIVGGAGRLMTWLANISPALADQVFSRAFYVGARDESRPPQKNGVGFEHPSSAGDASGDAGFVRNTSLYTALQLRPVQTLGMMAGVGVGLALLVGGGRALSR